MLTPLRRLIFWMRAATYPGFEMRVTHQTATSECVMVGPIDSDGINNMARYGNSRRGWVELVEMVGNWPIPGPPCVFRVEIRPVDLPKVRQ